MRGNVGCLAVAALVLAVASPARAEPLKVGIIEALSGPQASTGRLFTTAAHYVLDEINRNGGFNGQPIQVVDYDNGGNTSDASARFQQAAADGVRIVIQGSSSAVAGQVTEDVRKYDLRNPGKEILYFNLGAEAMELRGPKCHFHAFHFTTTAPMRVNPLVRVMAEQGALGKRVYAINQNYSWGQDMDQAIKGNAERQGYTVVESVLHEVNRIQDFAPYVAKIQAAKPDSVITGNWSNDLLLLMKATGDAGLKVTFGTAFLDQPGNLGNAGPTALGHYVAHPANIELGDGKMAEDFKAYSGHYPSYVEPGAINALHLVAGALAKLDFKGGAIDANRIASAIEQATYPTVNGDISVRREDHQVVEPVVVSKVVKGVKYPVDGTDMGFKPVAVVAARDALYPVQESCRMARP